MSRWRIHVLYEYGPDLRPHGSAYIRLLRPLTHPALSTQVDMSADLKYDGREVDAVILDRLWRPDISPVLARRVVDDVHRTGGRFIYAVDDNLLDLRAVGQEDITEVQLQAVRHFLAEADGVLVTTEPLRRRLSEFNSNIAVVPNALDERLLVPRQPVHPSAAFRPRRRVVGYMGTFTHDEELLMILPALERVRRRHGGNVEIQLVGGARRTDTVEAWNALEAQRVGPNPEEMEYPLFILWFTGRVQWDIALAPLQMDSFNRCKSDMKFLDYSAIGAAGIYSRVPPYDSSVRHGETGWLVHNTVGAWADALEELLYKDSLRVEIARNSVHHLYRQRIVARCADAWVRGLEDLLAGV